MALANLPAIRLLLVCAAWALAPSYSLAQTYSPILVGWGQTPGEPGYADTETHSGLLVTPTLSHFGQPELTLENLYQQLYSVRLAATSESAFGGRALRVNFDAGATPVIYYFYEVVCASNLPATTGGVTLLAKASHPIELGVAQGWYGSIAYPQTFQLTGEWQKINLPRSFFTLEWVPFYLYATAAQSQAGYILIDRFGVEDPFDASPTLSPAPNTDLAIHSSDLTIGSEHLSDLRSRLAAHEPLKIFGWGDSISAGARINQGRTAHPVIGDDWTGGVDDRFFGRLAAKLREHYGYDDVIPVAKAHGGDTILSETALQLKAEILAEGAPGDLVIIEFGANDINFGVTPGQMATRIAAAIDEYRAASLNVLVVTPPPCEQWDGVDAALEPALREAMAQLSANEQVPISNFLRLFTYAGNPSAFAQQSNNCHPSFWGHELMAQVLYAQIINASFAWSPANDFPQRQWENAAAAPLPPRNLRPRSSASR